MLKLVKQGARGVVRLLKAKRKGWLMFVEAKRQQEMHMGRLFRLKIMK